MRRFWGITTVLMVLVGAGALIFYFYLIDVQKDYIERLDAAKQKLQPLDERFGFTEPVAMQPKRWEAFLRVRAAVTRTWEEWQAQEKSSFDALNTQTAQLDTLAAALEAEAMSLREYRFMSGRYRGIAARGRDSQAPLPERELYAAWGTLGQDRFQDGVRTPWRDAPAPDLRLVHGSTQTLIKTLGADRLYVILKDLDK